MSESQEWFDLYWHNGHLILTRTARAEELLNDSDKTHFNAPFPLLIALNAVGTSSSATLKDNFLRKANVDSQAQSSSNSVFNLHLNDTSEPILFLDSRLSGAENIDSLDVRLRRECMDVEQAHHTRLNSSATQFRLGRFSRSEAQSGSGRKATDNIYYQLTGPFVDVYCIFADDIGLAASQILNWISFGAACVSDQAVKPGVVVVLEKDGTNEELKLIGQILLDILRNRGNRDPLDVFSSIQVVLAGKTRASISYLYDLVLRVAGEVRQRKEERHLCFSTRHTLVFVHQLCERLSLCEPFASEPFDFIRESRAHNPAPDTKLLADHLLNLIRTAQKDDIFVGPLAEVVANSLLLDALPPGMHFFHPSDVFETLYQESLKVAMSRFPNFSHLGEHFISRVAQSFETKAFLSMEASTLQVTQSMAEPVRVFWRDRFSELTCFLCLKSAPEIPLPCNHSICSNCTILFGERDSRSPWRFNFLSCPLCSIPFKKLLGVILKPPTAGYRLLCIDGGGARGVVPLQILVELQKAFALRIPIQEHFDLSFGTSSGALIIFALFANGWAETFCIEKFVQLVHIIFGPNRLIPGIKIPLLRVVHRFLFSYLMDSKYSACRIDTALQNVFGKERSLMEGGLEYPGKKFGVVATTIRGSIPCIFSNYTNVSSLLARHGYRLVKPKMDKVRIKLWEAARCSSAAPWFFKPKSIDGVGKFQDGGLTHNNPVNLALWEASTIWPSSQLDVVLSLGTGTTASLTDPPSPASLSGTQGRKDGFLPRLYRTFMSSLDGQRPWLDLLNRIPYEARWRYQRINTSLEGNVEPAIDDISQIESMRESTTRQLDPLRLSVIFSTLLASLFYFELTREPSLDLYINVVRGSGKILCRIQPEYHGILQSYLNGEGYQFYLDNIPIRAGFNESPFELTVQSPETEFRISISKGSVHFEIGGSPFTVESLLHKQWPFSPFGRATHESTRNLNNILKRKSQFGEARTTKKRSGVPGSN